MTSSNDRKEQRLYQELKGSEKLFRAVFEDAPLGMAMVGRDCQIIKANTVLCRMLGYTEQELMAMTFVTITHPDDIEQDVSLARRVFDGEIPSYRLEKRYLTKSGRIVWGNLVASAIYDQEGRFLYGLGIVEDITERKQAEEYLRQTREQLQDLSNRLLEAQEEERKRIALELHDQISQSLASLVVGLKTAEIATTLNEVRHRIASVLVLTEQTLSAVHHLTFSLRPGILDDLGLVIALRQHIKVFSQRFGIPVEYHTHGFQNARLPLPLETIIYRIVQEALINAAKHARPQHISLLIRRSTTNVDVIVADDGKGFNVKRVLQRPVEQRLGLIGMQERAALVGGSVTIESSPRKGTTILVKIPFGG